MRPDSRPHLLEEVDGPARPNGSERLLALGTTSDVGIEQLVSSLHHASSCLGCRRALLLLLLVLEDLLRDRVWRG